jgi:hypothetical protein
MGLYARLLTNCIQMRVEKEDTALVQRCCATAITTAVSVAAVANMQQMLPTPPTRCGHSQLPAIPYDSSILQ